MDKNKVTIVESKENWSEYILDDGSIIKLKPVVTSIVRAGKREDGSSIYNISFQAVVTEEKN